MPKISASLKQHSACFKTIAIYDADGFKIDKVRDNNGDDIYPALKASPFLFLYESAFRDITDVDPSIRYLAEIAKRAVDVITHNPDVDITRTAPAPTDEDLFELLRKVPYVLGCTYVNLFWIKHIYTKITDVFNSEFANFKGTAEEYFKGKNAKLTVAGRVYFHLVEAKEEDYPFAFLATYSEGSEGSVNHIPLKNALEQSKKSKKQEDLIRLLSAVSRVADKSELVSELVESGELFSPLKFTPEEAYLFLKETPIYEENGVICRIPNFWKRQYNTRLKLSVGSKEPSAVGLQSLIAFSPEIYLGDEKFTQKEIKALLSETNGLAFLKGKWVEVDHEKLQAALAAFEQLSNKHISLVDAIRMQSGLISPDVENEKLTDSTIEITNGQWLSSVINQMRQPATIQQQKPTATLKAALRQYQIVGFNWLNFMINAGFGALLADDMGLGKTVQILALLDALKKNEIKTLLVIPASLIQNWKKEAMKFAPALTVKILHGNDAADFSTADADLFITTYGMVSRIEKLSEITWDLLVLDEAQAIKNHGNKQTKAVKALTAKSKIAMTGTPVENRLSDLWSIFDFLNKGLLGTSKEFGDFAKSLRDNTAGYAKLRSAVSPFILRRLKTDKSIISDLPDKIETLQYTTLTKKQIVLYNQLVQELQYAMENDDDYTVMQRRAMILTSIMKCKQICNHPDQYTGNSEFEPKHSGKFETLSEICTTIADKRERVLVFTQFKEMTQPIARFLETVFGQAGLTLHGGTSVKKRGELVEQFNGDAYVPFMVLSLKAGGVGLNLTSANHVIHFDRWWNPAVENQATDRAFRIGQSKHVNVYKFVTTGTIEEKIDTVITNKQKLTGAVIEARSGEKWITEMDNNALMNLFRLEM